MSELKLEAIELETVTLDGCIYQISHFIDEHGKRNGTGVVLIEDVVKSGNSLVTKFRATGAAYTTFLAEIDKRKVVDTTAVAEAALVAELVAPKQSSKPKAVKQHG